MGVRPVPRVERAGVLGVNMKGSRVSRLGARMVAALVLAAVAAGGVESFAAGPYDRAWRLSYRIPRAWVSDPGTAKQRSSTCTLAPGGSEMP